LGLPFCFDEMNRYGSPIHTWTGGVRLDGYQATWPFAKLLMGPEALRLKLVFRPELVFHRGEIAQLHVYQNSIPLVGKLFNGIRFMHGKPGYPETVIFWYFGDVDAVARELVTRGFAAQMVKARFPWVR